MLLMGNHHCFVGDVQFKLSTGREDEAFLALVLIAVFKVNSTVYSFVHACCCFSQAQLFVTFNFFTLLIKAIICNILVIIATVVIVYT